MRHVHCFAVAHRNCVEGTSACHSDERHHLHGTQHNRARDGVTDTRYGSTGNSRGSKTTATCTVDGDVNRRNDDNADKVPPTLDSTAVTGGENVARLMYLFKPKATPHATDVADANETAGHDNTDGTGSVHQQRDDREVETPTRCKTLLASCVLSASTDERLA